MRAVYKLLSKIFPVAGAVIVMWALALAVYGKGSMFHGRTLFSVGVRITYTALFTCAMEYVSRYLHAYLWHCRFLWWIHGTHHHQYPAFGSKPSYNHGNLYASPAIEFNDAFGCVFAVFATGLMWMGSGYPSALSHDCSFGIGTGVTLYGLSYFIGHDIVAHERCGKNVARGLKRMWPYLSECASVHVKHHHKLKPGSGDPYGPPYGFWLGPNEIRYLAQGRQYAPMPRITKLLIWTSIGVYAGSLTVL